MDTKVIFRALLWSLAAFFVWQFIAIQVWPPQPREPEQAPATGPATPDQAGTASSDEVSRPPAPTQPSASESPTALVARGADAPQSFVLGGVEGESESPWRMQLGLSTLEASLRTAALSDFAQEIKKSERYRLLEEVTGADGSTLASMVPESLSVDGQVIDLRGVIWNGKSERRSGAEAVTFSLDLENPDGQAVLGLALEYVLPQQAAEAKRYDLNLTLSIANLDDQPHKVVTTLRGPVGTQRIDTRVDDRAVTVGNQVEGEISQTTAQFAAIAKSGVERLENAGGKAPFWWAAVGNKFFTCLLAPVTEEGREGPGFLSQVRAVDLDGVPETANDVSVHLITAERSIPAGGTATYPFACYLGPQDRQAFTSTDNPDYVRRNYYLLVTRNYSWCTFSWLTEFMVRLLDGLARVPPWNYGVAIIILVLVVRILLHPITKKGQVNMMKMQKQMGKLAPKLEEIKKQHANDKARLNQEMQKLYQAEGINPAGQMLTCLPMMLQMPIWIALYTSLNNNIGMRHEPFCLWIRDLTAPDHLIDFGSQFNLPLLGAMTGPISSLNILPILWAVSMYAQQKLMPKATPPQGVKSAQTDQAAQMQKMMPFMSILFALLFYNAPSGLTLYIMASTVFGTLEQLRIRQHIKEMEKGGGLEAAKKRGGPRGPLWWRRFKEQMLQRAREAQKQADDAHKLRGRK